MLLPGTGAAHRCWVVALFGWWQADSVGALVMLPMLTEAANTTLKSTDQSSAPAALLSAQSSSGTEIGQRSGVVGAITGSMAILSVNLIKLLRLVWLWA